MFNFRILINTRTSSKQLGQDEKGGLDFAQFMVQGSGDHLLRLGCLVILCNAEDRSKRLSYHWASKLQNVFSIKIGMKTARKLMKNKTTRSGVLVLCTASNFHVVNEHRLFTRIIYHLPSSKHYECTFRMIMDIWSHDQDLWLFSARLLWSYSKPSMIISLPLKIQRASCMHMYEHSLYTYSKKNLSSL